MEVIMGDMEDMVMGVTMEAMEVMGATGATVKDLFSCNHVIMGSSIYRLWRVWSSWILKFQHPEVQLSINL